ncbi:MAG: Ditrans,polycis-undecaprenyl-diphosphate synthase ((2E,6E)-farnesyl-diphosphate specific) [Alphaproteobacteria bacterium MarineAlpha9_Bin4]|nr:di-trans,poly-cis-decaprenylcistransferase [Pelagibacterales bacterium]PPR27546.1 MAG: Ditrans,polycis-undecaprenyl-diphosphate synthase ((2E,6E)-farnesyl-diphosphate specific) [Alphaproteobacteria bacterium MarineAlpha9_Bin4]|tara:strand:- start:1603 stop:2325 length:723 start_codon:yes stop_codon:yes gene_type:complete
MFFKHSSNKNILKHLGIIMDGNRRWAKSKGLQTIEGHKQGIETAKIIIKAAIEKKISFLTLYAFSSENWKRDPAEIKDLMSLLRFFLKNEIHRLSDSGVKVTVLGDISQFDDDIKINIKKASLYNEKKFKINLIMAINYGARQEITNAVQKICKKLLNNKIDINQVNEKEIEDNLYTNGVPDPDLIIRTGGDSRLSNFLLWQSAYAELMFFKKPWPDFTKKDFSKAISDYKDRERRFGGK